MASGPHLPVLPDSSSSGGWARLRSVGRSAGRTAVDRCRSAIGSTVRSAVQSVIGAGFRTDTEPTGWRRTWLTTSRVRWRRCSETPGVGGRVTRAVGSWVTRAVSGRAASGQDEAIEVVDVGAGVVATLELVDRDVTIQLTPGPVPLASGLVAVALYRQHGVTPQADGTGRAFVGIETGPDGSIEQAFEPRSDALDAETTDVTLRRVDCFRTLEEVPDVIETEQLAQAYRRLSPAPTFDREPTAEERQ